MIEVKIKAKIVRKKSRSSQFLFSTGHGAFPSPFFKRGSLLAAGLSARARRTAPTCDDDGSARRGSASASSRRFKSSGEKKQASGMPGRLPCRTTCCGAPAARPPGSRVHSASTLFCLLAPFRSFKRLSSEQQLASTLSGRLQGSHRFDTRRRRWNRRRWRDATGQGIDPRPAGRISPPFVVGFLLLPRAAGRAQSARG